MSTQLKSELDALEAGDPGDFCTHDEIPGEIAWRKQLLEINFRLAIAKALDIQSRSDQTELVTILRQLANDIECGGTMFEPFESVTLMARLEDQDNLDAPFAVAIHAGIRR